MLLNQLVETSQALSSTGSRKRKVELIAQVVRDATADELPVVVPYLSGVLRQRRTGVGWASLRRTPEPAASSTLTVLKVDRCFERLQGLSGSGSAGERTAQLNDLLSGATEVEQDYLRRLIAGEVRQGALESLVVEGIAHAYNVPLSDFRRAVMLLGDAAAAAVIAQTSGAVGLAEVHLCVGVPVQPMLAQSASTVSQAMERTGPASIECKLDGVRVQVHRVGDVVEVFSRSLDRITPRVPEVVRAVGGLPVRSLIVDGEAIALRPDGRPRPFQETGSRVASDDGGGRELSLFLFDVLHVNGQDCIDVPLRDRLAKLDSIVPQAMRVSRVETDDIAAGSAFFESAVSLGHEGVVVKSLSSTYEAGRRGIGWVKVKPRHTLDLVVLAVERGHGRRKGWLSNLHLGARDPSTGGFVMLGKTFKGLTDEVLRWQTERFSVLAVRDDGYTVRVQPVQVVEIAFDGIQRSPRYPAGMALRFARVLRYRDDKTANQADTIDTVRSLFQQSHGEVALE